MCRQSHLNPTWKTPKFFFQLPFKLNEEIKPTKTTHPEMTPIDLQVSR